VRRVLSKDSSRKMEPGKVVVIAPAGKVQAAVVLQPELKGGQWMLKASYSETGETGAGTWKGEVESGGVKVDVEDRTR